MTGFAEHVNDLGGVTSIALVPALYMATKNGRKFWVTMTLWFVGCLILAGLVWSGSLSGILAASTAVMVWLVLNKGGLKHILVLVLGSVAIVFLVHLVSSAKPEEPITVVAQVEQQPVETVEVEKGQAEEPEAESAIPAEVEIDEEQKDITKPLTEELAEEEPLEVQPVPAEPEIETGEDEKTELAPTDQGMSEEEKKEKALIELSKTYRVKRDEPPMLIARLIQLKEKTLDFETLRLRFRYYQTTWDSISQNIFVGVGVGHWNGSYETGELVHNLLLGSWYEGGLLALIGIVIVLGGLLKIGINVIQSTDRQISLMGISLFSAFCAFLVLGMAQPIYY